MAVLPHPWGEYMRLQNDLDQNKSITSTNWGLEEALNRILDDFAAGVHTSIADIDKVASSAARRERHRTNLIIKFGNASGPATNDAASDLADLKKVVSVADWQLLQQVGCGFSYAEIAKFTGRPPGGLRVRIVRLRRKLAGQRHAIQHSRKAA